MKKDQSGSQKKDLIDVRSRSWATVAAWCSLLGFALWSAAP